MIEFDAIHLYMLYPLEFNIHLLIGFKKEQVVSIIARLFLFIFSNIMEGPLYTS